MICVWLVLMLASLLTAMTVAYTGAKELQPLV